ncbi:DUF6042 family protein [Streptomyces sp. BRA346]|uniref:DUF6042 family protein n=1 Tax=Streptomyces sp. BRA346 TaxID=2878199 RepID=UPI004063DC91
MQSEPLTDWSPQNRELHAHQATVGGWTRMRPHLMFLLLIGLVAGDAPGTREDIAPFGRRSIDPQDSLEQSCWEDDSLLDDAELDALPEHKATAVRYAAHYGLPPLQTVNDVINLLVAAGVVHEIPDSTGVPRLHPAQPLPVPADVFPLDEDERAIQRDLQLRATYEDASYRIMNLFDPEGERHEEITTSLERLARAIDGNPHDARQAVQLLLSDGDFTSSLDPTDLPPHKVFQLRCDWAAFDTGRITLHGMDEDGRILATLPEDADSVAEPLPAV